jgi:hypothetical protein
MKRVMAVVGLAALMAMVLAPAGAATTELRDVKIVVGGKAKSNGDIKFSFTPTGGEAKVITVTIAAKMAPEDTAKDIEKEFKVALGDAYVVERPDALKVRIEAQKDGAGFTLSITEVTVPGVSVKMQ